MVPHLDLRRRREATGGTSCAIVSPSAESHATSSVNQAEVGVVPEISRFFGIVIRMYFDDHDPPHFHAAYGEHSAVVLIAPPGLRSGHLPPRVLALVIKWASVQEAALLDIWERLRFHLPVGRVPPLE